MEKKNATNVSHVITLLPLQVCKTAHSEGETMKVNKVIKILRCDSSLQLDQIVKLIPTDKYIHEFSECGKAFTCANYLCRHERSHTGENPDEGIQCGEAFLHHSSLRMQKITHTGEKCYKCSQCGKAYAGPHTLQIHERTHSGEKAYECNQCTKSFASHGQLRKHERIHTGEKPYK